MYREVSCCSANTYLQVVYPLCVTCAPPPTSYLCITVMIALYLGTVQNQFWRFDVFVLNRLPSVFAGDWGED